MILVLNFSTSKLQGIILPDPSEYVKKMTNAAVYTRPSRGGEVRPPIKYGDFDRFKVHGEGLQCMRNFSVLDGYYVVSVRHIWTDYFGFGRFEFEEKKRRKKEERE